MIRRIIHDANFEGQSRTLPVTSSFEEAITLSADGRLIHSAIENVVRNALRFTPDGNHVEITQTIQRCNGETMARIVVSDYGPGVPQEALKDLFNPFFRVPGKQGRTSGGAGVGLAIAFHAINLHHGSIRATNRDNGGLTVEIRLPINGAKTIRSDS